MSDDWIMALEDACRRASQSKVAGRIGYSAAVVNQVLRRRYKGDMAKVERAVRGALMSETVACPVMCAAIRSDQCMRNARDATSRRPSADPLRKAFRATCPTCPQNRIGGDNGQS